MKMSAPFNTMLLTKLNSIKPNQTIYSFGVVQERMGRNTFLVAFEEARIQIYTKERLKVHDWIRFVGTSNENGVIVCELVSVLVDVNIVLLSKAISYLES